MRKLRAIALYFALSGLLCAAHAQDLFTIKAIKLQGLHRIESGTIFHYLSVKVGESLTSESADRIIHKLYNTGFFSTVQLERQGDILIVVVKERPIIGNLSISGDHVFDHDTLVKSLKANGLAEGLVFESEILTEAVLSLKSEYYDRGLYSVVISTSVTRLPRNRVSISMHISEGKGAKIVSIRFVGNHAVSQRELLRQMFLSTSNLLSWWFKDNVYSQDKLTKDLTAVRSYYLNHGYIKFQIDSVQTQLTPDKLSVYITIAVSEGAVYKVSTVDVAGNTHDVPMAQLRPLVLIKPGQVVDQELIDKTVAAISKKLGDYGYAFATVSPVPKVDEATHTVAFTFFIDLTKKIYVRRINVSGNEKTRDTVIRRELRQNENALYNASDIERSKDRLNLLGYFKNVDVSTAPVPGVNNEADMNVKVDETSTGNINFGVGYAQGEGVLLNGSVSQADLLGSGKSASLNASTSLLNQNVSLSFTDPYYLTDGTSLGYDLYDNAFTPNLADISPYSTRTVGARARFGIPVSEFDKINFSVGFENNQVNLDGNAVPLRFTQFTGQFGNSVNAVPISIGWVRNTTDSALWPTTGATFSEVADMTAPDVGVQYYRFTSQNTWYVPITSDYVWRSNMQFGTINAYGGSVVPFYQNYFLGGIGSVRGYYFGTMGPTDTDGSAFGGTNEAVFSNEILFPMPGLEDQRTIRMSVFYDLGSLWGGNDFDTTAEQEMRAGYGVGLTWISPLGPITVSYALPMFNQPTDNLDPFQVMFGSSF